MNNHEWLQQQADNRVNQKRKERLQSCANDMKQLQRENAELREQHDALMAHINRIENLSVWSWVSAALEDDSICHEMKNDIEFAFKVLSETPAQSLHDFCARCTSGERGERDMEIAERVRGAYLKEVTRIIQSIQVRVLGDGTLDDEDSVRESAVFDVDEAIRNLDLSEAIKDA